MRVSAKQLYLHLNIHSGSFNIKNIAVELLEEPSRVFHTKYKEKPSLILTIATNLSESVTLVPLELEPVS